MVIIMAIGIIVCSLIMTKITVVMMEAQEQQLLVHEGIQNGIQDIIHNDSIDPEVLFNNTIDLSAEIKQIKQIEEEIEILDFDEEII